MDFGKLMRHIFVYETDALCSDGFLSQGHLKTNQLTIVWSNTPVEIVVQKRIWIISLVKYATYNACLEKRRRWRAKNPDKVNTQWAEYYEENKPEILARNGEYRKSYNLIELDCDVCECKVKKCRWSKHILITKHLQNHDEKSWFPFKDDVSFKKVFFWGVKFVNKTFCGIRMVGGRDGLEHGRTHT